MSAGQEDDPFHAVHKSKLILFTGLGYVFKDDLNLVSISIFVLIFVEIIEPLASCFLVHLRLSV